MSYKLDYSIESKIPAKLDYLRAKGGESGGGGGAPTYETLREFSVGEGANHVYAFTSSATKYDDSAGSNSLQATPGSTSTTYYQNNTAVQGAEGYMLLNSIDGVQFQSSGEIQLDRSTDHTILLVFQPTDTSDNGNILGQNDGYTASTQYIPFEVWTYANYLAITTPNALVNYQVAALGSGASDINANDTVAVVGRYIHAEDKVSWRIKYPGYVYPGDYTPSNTRNLRREDGNYVIYPYDNAHGGGARSLVAGSTTQVTFGKSTTDNATRNMRLFHAAFWTDEALTDEQADAFFGIMGL